MKAAVPHQQISVSLLKAQLLEVVRKVEKGESFSVTKDGKPVAELRPFIAASEQSAVGFAQFKITGDIHEPIDADWSFDVENIKIPTTKTTRKKK